jgi:hypothetical protein
LWHAGSIARPNRLTWSATGGRGPLDVSSMNWLGSTRRYRSVEEFPRVRSIEPSYLNSLLEAWIKVVEIDTVLAAWLRDDWLPVRDTPAGFATHSA